jgi:hypothetical protein
MLYLHLKIKNAISLPTNTTKKIGKNLYEVTYEINNKKYKMIVKPYLGPSPVIQVSNENLEDVTDIILPYLGPRYDWKHGSDLDISHFHFDILNFEYADGTSDKLISKKKN